MVRIRIIWRDFIVRAFPFQFRQNIFQVQRGRCCTQMPVSPAVIAHAAKTRWSVVLAGGFRVQCQLPGLLFLRRQAAQSTNANFCIAKELTPETTNPIFGIIFQTHPKTRQNPLREILSVLRQKYTWIFPVIFPGFPGLFPGFLWA